MFSEEIRIPRPRGDLRLPRSSRERMGMGDACAVLWRQRPLYKNYLRQYYRVNQPESVAQAWQDEKSRDSSVHTLLGSLNEQEAYAAGNGIGDESAASCDAGNYIRDGDGLVPFVIW
ncbi:unnamed protein product [Urochloa humidicola]